MFSPIEYGHVVCVLDGLPKIILRIRIENRNELSVVRNIRTWIALLWEDAYSDCVFQIVYSLQSFVPGVPTCIYQSDEKPKNRMRYLELFLSNLYIQEKTCKHKHMSRNPTTISQPTTKGKHVRRRSVAFPVDVQIPDPICHYTKVGGGIVHRRMMSKGDSATIMMIVRVLGEFERPFHRHNITFIPTSRGRSPGE